MLHTVCTIYCSVLPVKLGHPILGRPSLVNPTGSYFKRIPHSRVSTFLSILASVPMIQTEQRASESIIDPLKLFSTRIL